MERRRVLVQGVVQGVGFRPFVYRLAHELRLGGWVANSPQGAVIEVEAPSPLLNIFLTRLQQELPPHAAIHQLDWNSTLLAGECDFKIRQSEQSGAKTAFILPDLAICSDCLREIHDSTDRHYDYPFTNCTHCGPRFSIIRALPYDRSNTTMRNFSMCEHCRAEYEDPLNRRFHAQPTACPHCGPQLSLRGRSGKTVATRNEALLEAANALRRGQIVALKGLGGYQLLADARNPDAIGRLRTRKGRYEKPFAVMFPTLEQVESVCAICAAEGTLLQSSAAPIVLLAYKSGEIASQVAPDNPYLGVMLPYTPLHHLLMDELGFPIVATSGNRSGESIVIDDAQALAELGGIADLFLTHDRPIARPVDDSVVFVVEDQPVMVRRARGYAPAPIPYKHPVEELLAVGAQQKNTIAAAHHGSVFLSQHLGDMESAAVYAAFQKTLDDFQTLYDLHPSTIVCDLHPDYASTRYAEQSGLKVIHVQHHYAHILSCMAEHGLEAPVLGVAWDGTGYGTDGTIWGGEFLRIDPHSFARAASLRPFRLPGGDRAAREPRRSALGALYEIYGEDLPRTRLDFTASELEILIAALHQRINAPLTSSMGRLFDATAALIGLRQRCSFEGQAAMALEFAQYSIKTDECYPFEVTSVTNGKGGSERMIEWKPMIIALLAETDTAVIAAKFHNTLAAMIVAIAEQVGEATVVLSGGCFQNRALLEQSIKRLREAGFMPYWQQKVPPNDGGIALGQVIAAVRESQNVSGSSW
ncbi:MAG: carbamoyltransferase HypF [Chloroflexota bacterium]